MNFKNLLIEAKDAKVLFDSAYVELKKNQTWSVTPKSSTGSHQEIEGRLGEKGR